MVLLFMEINALNYFLSPGLGLLICFLLTKNPKVIFLATVKALSLNMGIGEVIMNKWENKITYITCLKK